MYCVCYMLSADRLCELPLEVRVLIAKADMEAYIRMYLYDDEFKNYANREHAIDDFIERFVVEYIHDGVRYKLGNVIYYKHNDGGRCWYKNNIYHRVDGPALIFATGDMFWYNNGKYHRDDGPAVMHITGFKSYWQNGERHRLDGPAIIYEDGGEQYYEYGNEIYK